MEGLHINRESNKFSLSEYLDDLSLTRLDFVTKDLMKKIKSELDEAYKQVSEDYIENQSYDLEEVSFIEEQLASIIEVKIIHLYKGVEIYTKKLISATYSVETPNMYKWDNLLSFLDGKGISYKDITGFDEVNQIRQVSNHLKHWIKGQKNKINHIQDGC